MAKILLVDDAMFMRNMLKQLIKHDGIEILEASNGIEAVEKYREFKPELVFMDITMPDMNGIEAVKAIKAIAPDSNIVMCSAMGQQTMVIEAMQAGAADFIVKPFKNEKVKSVVQQYLHIDISGNSAPEILSDTP